MCGLYFLINCGAFSCLSQTFTLLYLRFRSGVKDLEVMVQNVIASAFDSLSRVEEGVEILDVFHHFSAREVSIGLILSAIGNIVLCCCRRVEYSHCV